MDVSTNLLNVFCKINADLETEEQVKIALKAFIYHNTHKNIDFRTVGGKEILAYVIKRI